MYIRIIQEHTYSYYPGEADPTYPLNHEEMLRCLPERFQPPRSIVEFCDATRLGRPLAGTMNHHIGTHEVCLTGLLHANAGRDGWMRWVVQRIARTVAGPARDRAEAGEAQGNRDEAEPIIVVFVYCAHGKHRSVGLAYLLCQAMTLCGFATQLLHLSQPRWSRRGCDGDGGICNQCDTSIWSPARHQQLVAWKNVVLWELDQIDDRS